MPTHAPSLKRSARKPKLAERRRPLGSTCTQDEPQELGPGQRAPGRPGGPGVAVAEGELPAPSQRRMSASWVTPRYRKRLRYSNALLPSPTLRQSTTHLTGSAAGRISPGVFDGVGPLGPEDLGQRLVVELPGATGRPGAGGSRGRRTCRVTGGRD